MLYHVLTGSKIGEKDLSRTGCNAPPSHQVARNFPWSRHIGNGSHNTQWQYLVHFIEPWRPVGLAIGNIVFLRCAEGAAGFLIPVMSGIYWGSRHVDPGRLGILLQLEAVVGILSAALLAGEPFGLRQAIGAVLVVGAGFIEVLANREMVSSGNKR
jgi:hypothetical protein